MNRRSFLQAAASLTLASRATGALIAHAGAQAMPFDRSVVRQLARETASKSYKAPDTKLPDNLKKLDYDHYRQIRFLPAHALWRDEKLPFQVQFFHRGSSSYEPRVDIYEVTSTAKRPKLPTGLRISRSGSNPPPPYDADLGFAGFRIHAPITGRIIMTKYVSFWARAIFAPSPTAKSMALSA